MDRPSERAWPNDRIRPGRNARARETNARERPEIGGDPAPESVGHYLRVARLS